MSSTDTIKRVSSSLVPDAVRELPERLMPSVLLRGFYLTRLGKWGLAGRSIRKLLNTPPDLWEPCQATGKRILKGYMDFAGCTVRFSEAPDWNPETASEQWLETMHGFAWVRDVQAFNQTRQSSQAVRHFIADWLDNVSSHPKEARTPDIAGERIASWITHANFILRGSSENFRQRFWSSIIKQTFFLAEMLQDAPNREIHTGFPAVKGLLYAALFLPRAQYLYRDAGFALKQLLETQVYADGSHWERSPALQLQACTQCLEMQAAIRQARRNPLPFLENALPKMLSVLAFFRLGDGRLGLFNNSIEEDRTRLDMVFRHIQVPLPQIPDYTQAGFRRLHSGDTTVLIDAGEPCCASGQHHYGALSFECSAGGNRMVVNCGAFRGKHPAWPKIQQSTVAHSTLSINEQNSWDCGDAGMPGIAGPKLECTQGLEENYLFVDGSYDGYEPELGLQWRRRIMLGMQGSKLSGMDMLTPTTHYKPPEHPHSIAIRFHLHPRVKVMTSGRGAITLTLPNGQVWIFEASGGKATLEESIYLGDRGQPQQSTQIVLYHTLIDPETRIDWVFYNRQQALL